MLTTDIPAPPKPHPSWRVGIVHALYHEAFTKALAEGARQTLIEHGLHASNISLHPVLGSFEVPLIGAALAANKKVDALIGIGIIVKGETFHDEHLAREATRGCMDVQLQFHIPFAYEILHVRSLEDVQKRTVGEGSKGKEAALAVLHALAQLHGMH